MRVISGLARGHKLVAPEGLNTRPTTDRIKETLFNIISNEIYEQNFLDLFCGSGAIGIEALSRGASVSVFIDNNADAIETTNKNLKHTKLEENAVVIKSDVFSAIEKLGQDEMKFNLIFMDPPYELNLYASLIKSIKKANICAENCIIITEQPSNNEAFNIQGIKLIKEKKYKKTIMSFWMLEV